MIAGVVVHRPSNPPLQDRPVVDRRRTANDPRDLVNPGDRRSQSRLAAEFAFALGGGAVLLIPALLLHLVAAPFGVESTGLHAEQFASLVLAGASSTFVARELAVKRR